MLDLSEILAQKVVFYVGPPISDDLSGPGPRNTPRTGPLRIPGPQHQPVE